jgi:drug/metabolite transporter (DMT)-like permease
VQYAQCFYGRCRGRTFTDAVGGIVVYRAESAREADGAGLHSLAHRFYSFCGRSHCAGGHLWPAPQPFPGEQPAAPDHPWFYGSITFLSLVSAIRVLPVSTALVIFYSFPAFSAVFSFLIYGERIRKPEVACILTVLLGIGILFDFQLAGSLWGQAIALLSGCFAGLTVTLIRALRQNNGPVVIYLYFCTIGTLVTLPKFIVNPVLPTTILEWTMISGIVLVSVTAQLLMNQGFFFCTGWEGGIYMTSEVIFTAVVGIVFLSDPTSWKFWSGGLLILGSAVALNRLKANAREAETRI